MTKIWRPVKVVRIFFWPCCCCCRPRSEAGVTRLTSGGQGPGSSLGSLASAASASPPRMSTMKCGVNLVLVSLCRCSAHVSDPILLSLSGHRGGRRGHEVLYPQEVADVCIIVLLSNHVCVCIAGVRRRCAGAGGLRVTATLPSPSRSRGAAERRGHRPAAGRRSGSTAHCTCHRGAFNTLHCGRNILILYC